MSAGADRLKWVFELQDRMSGPAQRIRNRLADVHRELSRTLAASQRLTGARGGADSGMGGLVTSLNMGVDLAGRFAGVLGGLAGAFSRAASGAASFVFGQAAFRENSMTTLTALLDREQGAGAGRRAFQRAVQLAQVMPGGTSDLVRSFTQLTVSGFRGRGLENMFGFVSDMAARNPGDSDMPRRLATTIGQIRSMDRLDGSNFRELTMAGVNSGELLATLGRGRGMRGSQRAINARVQQMISSHQIRADEVFGALLQQNEATTGMRAGGFAMSQGRNLTGLADTLRSVPETLLQAMDFEHSAGLNRFKDTLVRVVDLLNTASPYAQRLQRVAARVTEGVAGVLFPRAGGIPIERVLGGAITAVERLASAGAWMWRNVFAPFGGGFLRVMRATFVPIVTTFARLFGMSSAGMNFAQTFERLGTLAGLFASVVIVGLGNAALTIYNLWTSAARLFNSLASGWMRFGAWLTSLGTWFMSIGQYITDGLAHGISQGAQHVWEQITGLGTGALALLRRELGIASPSRAFMELGGYTAEGFALGIERGAPDVATAVGAMVRAPDLSGLGARAAGAAGAGAVTVGDIIIQVPPGDYDTEALAERIREMLPSELLAALRRIATT